jgi:hypothetical protein
MENKLKGGLALSGKEKELRVEINSTETSDLVKKLMDSLSELHQQHSTSRIESMCKKESRGEVGIGR